MAPISFCETTTCTSPEATKRKNRGSAMKSECASPNRENPTGARAPHLSQVKDDLRPEGLEAGRDLLDAPHDLGPKKSTDTIDNTNVSSSGTGAAETGSAGSALSMEWLGEYGKDTCRLKTAAARAGGWHGRCGCRPRSLPCCGRAERGVFVGVPQSPPPAG